VKFGAFIQDRIAPESQHASEQNRVDARVGTERCAKRHIYRELHVQAVQAKDEYAAPGEYGCTYAERIRAWVFSLSLSLSITRIINGNTR